MLYNLLHAFINRRLASLGAACLLAATIPALAGHWPSAGTVLTQTVAAFGASRTYEVPSTGRLEAAFSPNGSAEALVVKVIDSARSNVRVMAYSFTSAPVVSALVRAQKRGAQVQVVVDHKSNTAEDKSGKSRAALSALLNAGADVRTIDVYAIAHDKVVIADEKTTELGSFNYSSSAQTRNSENVLVHWDNPALAKVYLMHFERNWGQGRPYTSRY